MFGQCGMERAEVLPQEKVMANQQKPDWKHSACAKRPTIQLGFDPGERSGVKLAAGYRIVMGMGRLCKISVALALAWAAVAQPSADKRKEWKERAEYELYEAVSKTAEPAQWVIALDKWKTQ